MKKLLFKSVAVAALGIGFASCSDFLDQKSPSAMDDTNIFSTYEYAQGAINNAYTYFGEQNYRARTIWYGYNTDIEYYNSSNSGDDKADLATFNTRPGNGQMNDKDGKDLWSQMYKGVERANLAIEGLRNAGETTDARMKHLLGEALTLRALVYMDLINMWGDVPARFEPMNESNMYIGRSNKDVIYKQLIADLQEAENLCAWPNELDITTTVTRVNKAFVKGLLARVCLQAAGYSLYRDGNYRLSDDPDLTKDKLYPIAEQACADVMAQEGKSVALKTKFEDIWNNKGISGDVITAGSESLFEVGYNNEPPRGRIMYTFGLKHNNADEITTMVQGSQVGPTPNFFFDYAVNDTRRDVTCCPFQWEKGVQVPQSINKWSFGKLRYEWTNRLIKSGNDEGINKLYMRYADIILMRAEAANYLYGPSTAAPYVKKIRERAFPASAYATQVEAYVNNATTKEAMLKLIIDERAFEFAGEFVRKADLIRWGILKDKLDEAKEKMTQLYNLEGNYADINPTLYWKVSNFNYTRDGQSYSIANAQCNFYGFNHGETADPDPSYNKFWTNSDGDKSKWISASDTNMEKVNCLYTNDPIKNMYWPIYDININDNPKLNNNFGDEDAVSSTEDK